MTIASIVAIEYRAISACAWLYRIKESVIILRVRYGVLNPWWKIRVPNHVLDVSMLTRVNGTSTSGTFKDELTLEKELKRTRWDICIRIQPYYTRSGI